MPAMTLWSSIKVLAEAPTPLAVMDRLSGARPALLVRGDDNTPGISTRLRCIMHRCRMDQLSYKGRLGTNLQGPLRDDII